jgi:hypothetical protein
MLRKDRDRETARIEYADAGAKDRGIIFDNGTKRPARARVRVPITPPM